MGGPIALTVDLLVAAARDQLGLSDEAADQLRPILETQVQSINRLRAIRVDRTIEPDMVFHAEGDHD